MFLGRFGVAVRSLVAIPVLIAPGHSPEADTGGNLAGAIASMSDSVGELPAVSSNQNRDDGRGRRCIRSDAAACTWRRIPRGRSDVRAHAYPEHQMRT
jgi:hypothetical protein